MLRMMMARCESTPSALVQDTMGALLLQAIQLKELKKIATLGAGAFGQVFLVKHDSKYYALKCLSKALVLETGLQVLPFPQRSDAE